jgi:hypothetical protein
MIMTKCVGLLLFAAIVGDTTGAPGVFGFVSPAEAVVGCPLTPVSVAEAARRVARRTTKRPVEAGYSGYGYGGYGYPYSYYGHTNYGSSYPYNYGCGGLIRWC